jgi:hypothetical protein
MSVPTSERGASRFDAFISYGHDCDQDLAPLLKKGIERYAKPWNRARVSRVCVDTTNLSADPALWSTIEEAMHDSAWLVVLASPDAAASRWVNREISWWCEHKSPTQILIVVTAGSVAWDTEANDFDRTASSAIPPALHGVFAQEPHWIELQGAAVTEKSPELQSAVIELVASIREIDREDLVGLAGREERRTRRLARGGVSVLLLLLVVAVAASVLAFDQRDRAKDSARVALSRELASTSNSLLTTHLDTGLLLAVQAFELDDNPQTRAALLRANTAAPHLVRQLTLDRSVTVFAGSGDGLTVLLGLEDGRVLRWRGEGSRTEALFRLAGPVAAIAVDRDGEVVAATDGQRSFVWQRGTFAPLALPPGQRSNALGVTPSGRTVVARSAEAKFEGAASVSLFDLSNPAPADEPLRPTAVRDDTLGVVGRTSSIVAYSDDAVLLLDDAYGGWERRRLADWGLLAESSAEFGAHQAAGVPASDGSAFTATNGAPTIPVWRTDGVTDPDHPPLTAEAPAISHPSALALSPTASRAAVADSGIIYVAAVQPADTTRPAPIEFAGTGSVDQVRFVGDDTHLISVSGRQVTRWDLDQVSRVASTTRTRVEPGCNACGSPWVVVSPDASRVAMVDGSGSAMTVQSLHGRGRARVTQGSLELIFDQPVWERDSGHVVLPLSVGPAATRVDVPRSLPSDVHAWAAGRGDATVYAAALVDAGRSVAIVDGRGRTFWHDPTTGAVQRTRAGLSDPGLKLGSERIAYAAIDPERDLSAIAFHDRVTVTDLGSGDVVARIRSPGISSLGFAGPYLLVGVAGGDLQVWRSDGSQRVRTIPGDGTFTAGSVGNAPGTMVARQRSDGSIALIDLETGTTFDTLPSQSAFGVYRTGMTFTPDGTSLVTVVEGYEDERPARLIRYDFSDAALVSRACRAAGRTMSRAEWQRYVGHELPDEFACR